MDTRRLGIYIARTRVGLGLVLVAAPRIALRPFLGDAVDAGAVAPVGRMLGGRDAILGAGAAIALAEREGGANWVSMLAVADGVDAVVLLATPRLGWRARLLGLFAAASAVGHFRLSREVARTEARAENS
jgi:hypothetical protein